ncbi:LPS O-antigen chain length determinant protein, WzzB/FepE family [Ferrimonas sediminum]|uniref:LPS O-antigen chain length determinant protein, WzzB/FepE family n=1 Tax=Ferrimonas sediminum TaxID=718193 RepID=A0A1G8YZC4_9GAMM|nr:Wzz/FepE/Etk N-terminal domain-containing protein [Ferrimonas sediminum]SDK08136.1 LPS O-antigen chain length determinant protein, WzzB/FepE family [Ferrimonas sediminum]
MTQQQTQHHQTTSSIVATRNQDATFANDEIDLRELFSTIWAGKWLIILITAFFAVSGVVYSLLQPNIYKSETVLVPASQNGQSGLAGMAAQFGGLASLAGINLNSGGSDDTAIALATLESRQFINYFINKHNLLVPLMASKNWNQDTGKLNLDGQLYDSDNEVWIRDVEPPKSVEPSEWESYEEFKNEVMSISQAKDTGLVTVTVTHHSPLIAQRWATLLVEDLNAWMKDKSLADTKRNINYLVKQLEKTAKTEMQTVFYQLIEEQTKQLMLSELEEEFSFKTIDPAVVPEEKTGPKRALICVLTTLLGGMLGVFIVLIRHFVKKS